MALELHVLPAVLRNLCARRRAAWGEVEGLDGTVAAEAILRQLELSGWDVMKREGFSSKIGSVPPRPPGG